jgi:hypothetical protein
MTTQQSNCRPFVLHCGRCGEPGHTARECAESEDYNSVPPKRSFTVNVRYEPPTRGKPLEYPRVSLPAASVVEPTPAEETRGSAWDICQRCGLATLYCKGH